MARVPGTNAWIEEFNYITGEELSEPWSLNFNYQIENELNDWQRKDGWKIYKTSAFGRFYCRCSNSWPSARVSILFHYRRRRGRGLVLLRPFGQQCRECTNHQWLKPQVDPAQMHEVFERLIAKIRKNCYNNPDVVVRKRSLVPRKTRPHETDLCEACHLGICDRIFDATENET
ncbi:receptor-transporting protein 3-like [Mobula hypostoma]|uniref:receptor-transporting protein 3-like n=1 Tax=Mobula hypostoma TaxID=723540 RepID=UPI002FC2F5CF